MATIGKLQQDKVVLAFDGPIRIPDHVLEQSDLICGVKIQQFRVKAVSGQ